MKRHRFTLLLLLWCSLSLNSSVSWDRYLVAKHFNPKSLELKPGLFHQAIKLKLTAARLAYYRGNSHWSAADKVQWLSHPSMKASWQAHWYLALVWQQQQQFERAQLWFTSAVKQYQRNSNSSQPNLFAQMMLDFAVLRIDQKSYDLALNILNQQMPSVDELEPLIAQNKQLIQVQHLIFTLKLNQAQQLLELLGTPLSEQNDQQMMSLNRQLNKMVNGYYSLEQCLINIQMMASDHQQWLFGAKIIDDWQQDQQLKQLPICFKPIREFEPQKFDCVAKGAQRQNCDLRLLAQGLTLQSNALPVFIQGNAGIANYNNGVIFINHNNSYGVFVHELLHHFGFIDEYPLIGAIGQKLCEVTKVGKLGENLMVVPTNQLDQYKKDHLNSFAVPTCDNFTAAAFKPVSALTVMQYMDQSIPKPYIQRLRQKLTEYPNEISNYQYAFALAYDEKDQLPMYRYWLQKSADQGYQVAKKLLKK